MSAKERILMAIYQEQTKGNSDMSRSVRHEGLQVDPRLFNQAIQTLQKEGLIRGAVLVKDRNNNFPEQVFLNRVALTHYGLHYLRKNLLAKARE